MEGNPSLACAVIEFDVKGSHVCLKCKSWRSPCGTKGVVDSAVLVSHSEIATYSQGPVLWQIGRDPGREAVGIAVIASLRRILCPVQVSVEVLYLVSVEFSNHTGWARHLHHLFSRVVLVHVLALPHDLIY